MKKTYNLIAAVAIAVLWLASCNEASRYEISGSDTTPPDAPLFIDSSPLPGGARIYFEPPADKDVLSVEAAYLNSEGETVRFAASYFTNSLDVYGFGSSGEHEIDFYAVDRSGNRSRSLRETVIALEPPVETVAQTVELLPSFFSILLKWENLSYTPVYITANLSYKDEKGVRTEQSVVIASYMTETHTLPISALPPGEPLTVGITVRDKYGNTIDALEETIELLEYEELDKSMWRIPEEGTAMGGVVQAAGVNLGAVNDGIVDAKEPGNFFTTSQTNPWNIIIDLGAVYKLSNVLTHQRMSGVSGEQGDLYKGNNVKAYNLYGWDESSMEWVRLMRHDITMPVVVDNSQYMEFGLKGDMTYIYPEEPRFSEPTRWVRFEAINGSYISEITLFGCEAE